MRIGILTSPDRFGLAAPSKAWEAFETGCLAPLKLSDCYIADASKREPIPSDVTKVLLLGPKAVDVVFPGRELDKIRGTPIRQGRFTFIASYHPDNAQDQERGWLDDETSNDAAFEQKDTALTQPSNYFFWLRSDTKKLLSPPRTPSQPFKFVTAPNLDQFLAYVESKLKSGVTYTYIDIECRREDHCLNCIGIALDGGTIFVLPIYAFTNQRYYGAAWKILVALGHLFCNSTVVVHNSLFDLFVLARYYRVPIGGKVFDTMLAHHRIHPEVEKSLGHVISYWTDLPFHKDQNIERPRNGAQQAQLWEYNAKDIYSMREVHLAQLAFLSKHSDYAASVAQANREVYPYLLCQLRGLRVDEDLLNKLRKEKTRRVANLRRIAITLSGVKNFNPGSAKQCIDFFHGTLKYEVVARTETGAAKMDQKALYKLRLKNNNPLLDVIIAYRIVAKELSMLQFNDYTPPHYAV